MKKMMSMLAAVVLTLAMTVTAFAAPSPSEEEEVVSGTVTLADGTTVTVDSTTASKYVSLSGASYEATAPDGYTVLSSVDVTLAEGVSKMDVVLSVEGVKKGETVVVMQYVDGKWITLTGTAIADNQVQVTVEASGTLAVCVASSETAESTTEPATESSDNGSGSSTGSSTTTTGGTSSTTSSTTSPKTGEGSMAVVALLAIAFAGAAVAAGKKVNA